MKQRLILIVKTMHRLIACWLVICFFPFSTVFAFDIIADTASGEILFRNFTGTTVNLDGYQFDSLSGALLPGNLGGVTGELDMSGDMSLDADSDWFVIASTTNSIAEASLVELSGSLDHGETVSLGILWDFNAAQDVTALVSAGPSVFVVPVDFLDLTGDYDTNGIVNLDDYLTFTTNFGSTIELGADGNGDGIVDAADFTIWRDAFEVAVSPANNVGVFLEPGTNLSTSFASTVPEPNSLMLACFACIMARSNRKPKES